MTKKINTWRTVWGRWLVLLVILNAGVSAQAADSGWENRMRRGYEYEAEWSFGAAAQQYDLAYLMARSERERVETLVALADVLVRSSREGFVEPARVQTIRESRKRAIRLYRDALRRLRNAEDAHLDPLEVRVVNNLSTVLLLEGQAKEAVRRLEECREKVTAADQPRYLFNLAKAHEKRGAEERALGLYLEAGLAENGYPPALQEAGDLVLDESNLMETRGSEFLTRLIDHGEYELVEEVLEEALDEEDCDKPLDKQDNQVVCQQLAVPLMRYLMVTQVNPDAFAEHWALELSNEGRLGDVSRAFDGRLTGSPDERSRWADSPGDQKVFAAFVKHVGDLYYRQRQNRFAFESYRVASLHDPDNHEATIYLLNLLSIAPEELDPDAQLLWTLLARGPADDDDRRRGEFFFMVGNAFDRRYRLGEDGASKAAIGSWTAAKQLLARDSSRSIDILSSVDERLASASRKDAETVDHLVEHLRQPERLEEALQQSAARVQWERFTPDLEGWTGYEAAVAEPQEYVPYTSTGEVLARPESRAEYQEFITGWEDYVLAEGSAGETP
jgi:tetratricopeptide (TPR) repeat protein